MKMSLRDFCRRYVRGDFDGTLRELSESAGWRDWVCKDKQLPNRLKKIWHIIKGIKSDFVLDNYTVYFKNNLTLSGKMFDDIRFEPLDGDKRDELYFCIAIDCPFCSDKYTVFVNGQKKIGFGTVKEIRNFINNWRAH